MKYNISDVVNNNFHLSVVLCETPNCTSQLSIKHIE